MPNGLRTSQTKNPISQQVAGIWPSGRLAIEASATICRGPRVARCSSGWRLRSTNTQTGASSHHSEVPIDLASVTEREHQDQEPSFLDRVHDSIVTRAHTQIARMADKRFRSRWPRRFAKEDQSAEDTSLHLSIQFPKVSSCRRGQLDDVLVSQARYPTPGRSHQEGCSPRPLLSPNAQHRRLPRPAHLPRQPRPA